MNKFQNGKIYKLENKITSELLYIGSTCVTLARRKYKHNDKCLECPNRLIYKHINTIGKKNIRIVLIENYPCESLYELSQRERYYMDKMSPPCNINRPLTMSEKENYDRKYKQTDRYKQWRRDYDKSEKGIAARKRQRQSETDRKKIKANQPIDHIAVFMKTTLDRYSRLEPIKYIQFKLE